jgi:hypothetical protein
MLLSLAMGGANGPKDAWIHELRMKDYNAASDDDREAAAVYLNAHGMHALAPMPMDPPMVAGSTKLRPSAPVPGQ